MFCLDIYTLTVWHKYIVFISVLPLTSQTLQGYLLSNKPRYVSIATNYRVLKHSHLCGFGTGFVYHVKRYFYFLHYEYSYAACISTTSQTPALQAKSCAPVVVSSFSYSARRSQSIVLGIFFFKSRYSFLSQS